MRTHIFAWFATAMLAPSLANAEDEKAKSAAVAAAARHAWEITDLVLEKDIDPPAPQQMLLHGIKALLRQRKEKIASNLAERVSAVAAPEQFTSLLAEVWPTPSRLLIRNWRRRLR